MRMSDKLKSIAGEGGDGWELFLRARGMIASGTPVTELTIGEHDIRTAAPVLQAMHEAAKAGNTGYAIMHGQMTLREAVAARVQARTGVPTTYENVLITPGGQSALFAAHIASLDNGQTALYMDPFYATYPGTIRAVGAVDKPVPARAEHAFQPQRADLEAAINESTRTLLINSPNNPTGVIYTPETMQMIADVVQAHGLTLISDEVYDTQIWEGVHISPRSLEGMADHTLVVGSMSKSHAMTGSRCGWLVGPADVIDKLVDLSTVTTYGVPGYIQDAALFALEQGESFEEEIAAPFKRRREVTLKALASQNILTPVPTAGAMYVMLDVRQTGLTGEEFANRLLDERHIAVMPGGSFGNEAAGHVRVAMTIEDSAYEAALKDICSFAAALA
ncbi:pyridoxal phosphate-dependent aminotransferase [Lentibacter algarum]|uniref:pyridoxal phosphate-dependent aminotransferase n=1 Tax=Lentibacter algarum TaxID=576131 RepID=UPI001C093DCF|nr:pyridoxal phosphate-dependent aminotransferase [Lentibacter algarum]MBU2982628.1 pyridoxal phosphate-dependent aminotransferase [Lentibacter algarum]